MQIELKRIVKPSLVHIFLYVAIGLIIWAATYIGAFYVGGISFEELLPKLADPGLLWKNAVSIALTLLNSILLSQLISRFSFVNTRTFLPVFVFALLITIWEPAHVIYKSHIALLFFICALFQFFNMHQNRAETEKAFLGSLFISCGSLFINDLIFLVAVCWLGFTILRCFSFRIFLASVIGTIVPWLIYGSVMYAFFSISDFNDLFSLNFSLGFSMDGLQLPTKIYIGLLFVMFFISLFGTYTDFHKHTNNTRANINFILILLIYFIIVFLLQNDFAGTFFPFIALCFSIFISNVFSTKKTNFYSILFLIFLILNLLFVVYNFLW